MPWEPYDEERIRVWNDLTEQWVTFLAKQVGDQWCISVEGPVRMILDQIEVSPARTEGQWTGIYLNYRKETGEFDSHGAGSIICPPEMEEPFLEWFEQFDEHHHEVVVETPERMNQKLEASR